jgi:endonuclease III-like uncharacterized protein
MKENFLLLFPCLLGILVWTWGFYSGKAKALADVRKGLAGRTDNVYDFYAEARKRGK